MIVISYRRDDSQDITGRIFDRLTQTFGREKVFRDIDSIPVGIDFREHIGRVFEKSELLLVMIGPRWAGNRGRSGGAKHQPPPRIDDPGDFVRAEVEIALEAGIPIVPVLVGNAQMPDAARLPQSLQPLAYRNALRVDSGLDFETHIARLLRVVDETLQTRGHAPHAAPPGRAGFGQGLKWVGRSSAYALPVAIVVLGLVGVGVYYMGRTPAPTEVRPPPTEARPENRPAEITPRPSVVEPPLPQPDVQQVLLNDDVSALRDFLRKHPDDPRGAEVFERMSSLLRSKFTEWAGYEVAMPAVEMNFFRYDTIHKLSDYRYTFLNRYPISPKPATPGNKEIPEGSYGEAQDVFDCGNEPRLWTSEVWNHYKNGDVFYHYKWSEPKYVESIRQPEPIKPGSMAAVARSIACSADLRTPLLTRKDDNTAFQALASTPKGDGDLLYQSPTAFYPNSAMVVVKLYADRALSEMFGESSRPAYGDMKYRFEVELVKFDCDVEKYTSPKKEYYTAEGVLEYVQIIETPQWYDVVPRSPLSLARQIACGKP